MFFNKNEQTNETEHSSSIQISEDTKTQKDIYAGVTSIYRSVHTISLNEAGDKNTALSVPIITFEHPSMDELEPKIPNIQLKSDSQEKFNEDYMEQTEDICSVGLSTSQSQELESHILPTTETPMSLREEDIANIIQDSNER